MGPKQVAIIGAGASGLTAIRNALTYDIDPIAFEASTDVGGLWRFKPEETDESSVMKSTVINTSKEMTAFSDFPPPADFANFMHNRKMLQYLRSYAAHFDLLKYIRFGCVVENVERSPNYKTTGSWIVTYRDAQGQTLREEFDGVLLCTGHHTNPFFPAKWSGQEQYKGVVSHAHSYKDHRGYEDKVVAVVGVGNSGVDIAVELSRIASQVYLSTRRGTWVLHRNLDHSIPFDLSLNRRILHVIRSIVPNSVVSTYVQGMVERRFDHAKFGLKPNHGIFSAHWTVNDELPNRLACGTIIVKPDIQSFIEDGLCFVDGTEIKGIDNVIFSTGYSFEFPLAERGKLIPVVENDVALYKNMYPLETSDHNSLAVIGLIQPLGSIMPISEMQSRVFFNVLTGLSTLPDQNGMRCDIENKRANMRARYVESRRHTIQVDYVEYMDELAELINCKPQPLAYLFSDPVLAYKLLLEANSPYAYRLQGPKPWAGARNAIINLNDRVYNGMAGGNNAGKYLLNDKRGTKGGKEDTPIAPHKKPLIKGNMNTSSVSPLLITAIAILCLFALIITNF